MRVNKLRSALFLFLFVFNISVYANDSFDELFKALSSSATKIELENIEKKYQGERITGKANILCMSSSEDGLLVTLTKDDPVNETSVEIGVFVRESMVDGVRELPIGKKALFSGKFEGLRMSTIIVREGYVK